MKIRLIGLGKMGLNFALNLHDNNHEVIGYDPNIVQRDLLASKGVVTVDSYEKLLRRNNDQKIIVWLLVPNKIVDEVITSIKGFLRPDDIIVDGGNSNYKLSIKRHDELLKDNIHYLDVGTSGGINGARNGACLMIGGSKVVFEELESVFKSAACKNGYSYIGPSGSGHFVKMVHNGIEYGMMQAIAEGFELMDKSSFNIDYKALADCWNHGSIITSKLIEYTKDAFEQDTNLESIEGRVDDSGEGKWMVEEALNLGVSLPVISLSLFTRFKSRDEKKFAEKTVAAMRNVFGGHSVYKKK